MAKKKQKLAIYGCSYADSQCGPEHLQSQGWSKLLEQDYIVDNYARAGSSNFYNYKNFLETHHNYDKVIFSQTTCGRWYYPLTVDEREVHISAIQQINGLIEYFEDQNIQDTILHKKLESLKMYYLHLEDYSISKMIEDALLFHLKAIRKDLLIIPVGFWRISHEKFIKKFNFLERKIYHKDPWLFEETNLLNHFPIEYHTEIYTIVKQSIDNGNFTRLFLNPGVDLKSFDYYFERIK